MSEQLRLTTFDGSSPVYVHAVGEIDLATARELETTLCREGRPGAEVHLDLSGVTFIDSSGLHALDRVYRRADREAWTLTIVNPSEAVERLFTLTGLSHWLGERSSV